MSDTDELIGGALRDLAAQAVTVPPASTVGVTRAVGVKSTVPVVVACAVME